MGVNLAWLKIRTDDIKDTADSEVPVKQVTSCVTCTYVQVLRLLVTSRSNVSRQKLLSHFSGEYGWLQITL